MARKKIMQKKSGKGKLIGGVAIGLVIAIGAGVLGFYTKGFRDWSFGKAEEPPASEADYNEQLLLTPEESNGIRVLAETEVTEEGKKIQRITATVLPEAAGDTEGATIEWSLNFEENPLGSWGNETKGEIGEYLKIHDTEQANVKAIECLKPFGTKAAITVKLQAAKEFNAKCKVDYVQKALGGEIRIWNEIVEESHFPKEYAYDYRFTVDQTNVTLPFPYATSEDYELRFYSMYVGKEYSSLYAQKEGRAITGIAESEVYAKFSEVYTIANEVAENIKVEAAVTNEYDAMISTSESDGVKFGFLGDLYEKPTVGEFKELKMPEQLSIMSLLVEVGGLYLKSEFDNYVKYAKSMKQWSPQTVQVKVSYKTKIENRLIETIYDVSWETIGLPVIEGIQLNPEDPSFNGGIEF